MTGRIPPYGKWFRRESREYSHEFAGRRYVLKANAQYGIISNKTSKRWFVYFEDSLIKGPYPNMRGAMAYLMPVHHDTTETYQARISYWHGSDHA